WEGHLDEAALVPPWKRRARILAEILWTSKTGWPELRRLKTMAYWRAELQFAARLGKSVATAVAQIAVKAAATARTRFAPARRPRFCPCFRSARQFPGGASGDTARS